MIKVLRLASPVPHFIRANFSFWKGLEIPQEHQDSSDHEGLRGRRHIYQDPLIDGINSKFIEHLPEDGGIEGQVRSFLMLSMTYSSTFVF